MGEPIRSVDAAKSSTLDSGDGQQFKRLAMVAEFTSNAAIVTDCESRIVWVNAGFTRITGYSFEEVIGKVPGRFLQCEETNQETVSKIRAAIRSVEGFKGEILNRGKNGLTYWLELDIQPIFDELGAHTGFIAIESDITALKATENVLREADEFQNEIFDALPSRIAVISERGIIQHVNANWRTFIAELNFKENFFSCGCNYLLNLGRLSGPHHQETLAIREGIRRVLDNEVSVFNIEFQLYPFDVPVWIELTVTAFTRSGKPRLVLAHTDITSRKLAELRVVSNEHRLRSIYESSSDAILLLTETGEILESNPRAKHLFCEKRTDSLIDQQLAELSPRLQPDGENSTSKFAVHLQLALATGSNRFEWEFTSGSGYDFPSEVFFSVLPETQGTLLQCTVRDISERRDAETWLSALQNDLEARTLAEKALREASSYLDAYRKIVDYHAIVAETDTAGTIVSVNDAFCAISGYSRAELIGQNHRILNSGHHDRLMWVQMYKTVANGGHWHGEICNRAKNGSLYWVDTTIAPLYNDLGKIRGYFSIRADITSFKEARVAAEAASRSKSEFLANMSHEIRTPMTAILGYTDILADYLQEAQASLDTREYVETIRRNGDHLLSIINDILDISKIEADKMTIEQIDVSPTHVVSDVMALMSVKALAKGIQLESLATTATPHTIQTDPTRLRQILVNLVGNAIKFTELGSVKLIVHMHPTEPNKLCFDIKDTGIGLSEKQLSKLFQAFEQADSSMTRKFGGTGLGLRISKRLAMMLGGDICVTSELGKGSTFSVSIATGECGIGTKQDTQVVPIAKRTPGTGIDVVATNVPPTVVTPSATATYSQLDGVRILLAEDGPDNQRLITFLLRKAGAEVRLVENGKLAVESLTQDGTISGPLLDPLPVDLILMDMQMPEMDGYEATGLLKSKNCPVPILALTAHAMSAELNKCMEAGCAYRLTKPIDRKKLLDACADWGRKFIRPPVIDNVSLISPQVFQI